MRLVLALTAVLGVLSTSTVRAADIAGPSDFLSAGDRESLVSALSVQRSGEDGSYASSAQGTHRATHVLSVLSSKKSPAVSGSEARSSCSYLETRLKASVKNGAKGLVDVASAYGGARALGEMGHACKLSGADAAVEKLLTSTLTDAGSKLGPLHHAALAAAAGAPHKASQADLDAAATRVLALRDGKTGMFRADAGDKKGKTLSALHAGRAVEVLCALRRSGAKIAKAPEAVGALRTLFSSAKTDGESLWFEDAVSNLAATSAVAVALECAADVFGEVAATDAQIVSLAEFFVGQRHAGNTHTAFHAVRGLAAFASASALPTPVVLSVTPGIGWSLSRKDEPLEIRATDVLGAASSDVPEVVVTRAVRDASSAQLVSGKKATAVAGKPGQFSFAFVGTAKPEPGMHTVTLSGKAGKKKGGKGAAKKAGRSIGVDAADFAVKVTTAAKIKDVVVAVSDLGRLDDKGTKRFPATFPKKVRDSIAANAFQHVHVGFTVPGRVVPAQAFVRFSSGATSVTRAVRPKKGSGKKGKYVLDVSLNDAASAFSHTSGSYSVTVYIGDASFDGPIAYNVADVDLEFRDSGVADEDEDDEVASYATRREIFHTFRDPAPRPPVPVSYVFAILQLALPFVVLLPLLRLAGANLDGFPKSGAALVNAVAFQASILAILAIFAMFWIGVNIFSTLKAVACVTPFSIYFGQKALGWVYAGGVNKK